MQTDRRTLIRMAAAGLVTVTSRSSAQVVPPAATPPQMTGPFYPIVRPHEASVDLTRVPGRSDLATGIATEIVGTVRTARGDAVASAILLLWQANAAGRYSHPRDTREEAPLDPAFLGHGMLRTDRQGSFRIRTVRPGAYPDSSIGMRTPHIHYEIIGEDARLVTQMYFPGEPLNDQDALLRRSRAQGHNVAALIARPLPGGEPGVARFSWDIVLDRA